jgi:glutamyl-tRNA synthetase
LLGKIMPLALQRLETFSDFFPLAQFLLNEQPVYTLEELNGKLDLDQPARLLKIAEWELEKLPDWDRDSISSLFQRIAEVEEMKLKQLLPLFFVAITGSTVSLPLFDGISILGPDLTRMRLRHALEKLADHGQGLSKKGTKKLEKEYASTYGNRID